MVETEESYQDLLLTCNEWYWIILCFQCFLIMSGGIALIYQLKNSLSWRSFLFIMFLMTLFFSIFMVNTWQYWWDHIQDGGKTKRKCTAKR